MFQILKTSYLTKNILKNFLNLLTNDKIEIIIYLSIIIISVKG